MQMLCKVLAGHSDVSCPVCGQEFSVYWTRNREISRTEQRDSLGNVLRAQHAPGETWDIHAAAFELPDLPPAMPRRIPGAALVPAVAMSVYY